MPGIHPEEKESGVGGGGEGEVNLRSFSFGNELQSSFTNNERGELCKHVEYCSRGLGFHIQIMLGYSRDYRY